MRSKIRLFISFLVMSLFFINGCQQEVTEIIEPPSEEVFTQTSPVADLIERTSLNDGSFDNIVDGASCLSLELPVTVIVNGLEITLDSQEDFTTVENIIDKFDDDDDIINIIFPVTVILADHSEIVLSDQDDLENLVDQCTEDGDDDDIECADFKFPMTLSLYDAANQVSEVKTVENDKELYKYIHDLDEDEYCGINFPITVILSGGDEIMINNNDELEDILKNAINACDEDDDNDHNDDDIDDSQLVSVLIDGNWAITYFFDDKDETAEFSGFIFTFFENGTAKAKKGDIIVEGNWHSYGDDGSLELEFDFGINSPFDELQDDWDLIEFDGTIIKLKDISGGDGSLEYLTFERPSDNQGGETNPLEIADVIIVGKWVVASYINAEKDETVNFNGFELGFTADGKVTATKGDDVLNGTWSTAINDGIEKLVLDFGEQLPFDEFNDDWDIIEVKEARIELKDVSGGDGSISKLAFEKL